MEKLPMCRVCLAENIRMYIVVNKNLRELYEKLTDNPFITEDSRPMLTCYFCCAKLKQCYQFQRKCLEAEELFTQMMNEDFELNPLLNQDYPKICNGFIQTPMLHMSIDDEYQSECIAIKEELPDVCERLDDIIEPKEEHLSDELVLENQENGYSDVEDIPAQHSELSSEDDELLTDLKPEVEKVVRKWRASDTQRAPVAENEKLHSRRTKPEDVIIKEEKEYDQSDTTVIQHPQNCLFTTVTKFKEPLPYTAPRVTNSSLDINVSNNEGSNCKISSKCIDSDDLKKHPRLCVQEKRFKCNTCQRGYNFKGDLTRHIRLHTGGKPYKCDICQRFFNKNSDLTRHIRTHTGETPYKCEVCHRRFKMKAHLTTHIRIHTGEKPYKCDVCQRCFSVKKSLTSHIRTHTGEKPYKCEVCNSGFKTTSQLTNHIPIHTGEKPYKCDICQSSFNRKDTLRIHILIHTGEKPHKCEICHCSFNIKGYLTKHIRKSHAGEKPFKCDVCQRCFSAKRSLTSHIRTHTG